MLSINTGRFASRPKKTSTSDTLEASNAFAFCDKRRMRIGKRGVLRAQEEDNEIVINFLQQSRAARFAFVRKRLYILSFLLPNWEGLRGPMRVQLVVQNIAQSNFYTNFRFGENQTNVIQLAENSNCRPKNRQSLNGLID